ncbi:MAG: NADH-quinone oxidoreductase subunit J [Phycisphaeraceae bacterium]|nr:NADH-quinone oxidoreductase subunit J [Phycisphaeraceae bacterium]MCW5761933.1 NADH-quinone oxidoreductase subunit J [Phycisphaeraceae bacterium]
MNEFLLPILLYGACAAGAVGVALALPRRQPGLSLIGALVALGGGGLGLLMLFLAAGDVVRLPNLFFYVFALLSVGSAVRMITHPRPVYSALYFILTVIASAGLFVLLSAEFMAFALIIIYAGAILITYLFVIMLATQAPTEGDTDRLEGYDAVAREPIWAAAVGFVLLAALTTMLFRGVDQLPAPRLAGADRALIADMPRKLERNLREAGVIEKGQTLVVEGGRAQFDPASGQVMTSAGPRQVPEDLRASNIEQLGFNLLADHPMTLEIAGVILLMAMLGATVLARKQVDLEEEAKARQARRLALGEGRDDA